MFRYADDWGCECAQTYITLSRTWKVTSLSSEEVSSFRLGWRKSNVKEVIAHAPLIVNLASPSDDIWQKSKNRLSLELSRTNELGIKFLVLHAGNYGNSDRKRGIERVAKGLNHVLANSAESTSMLVLETSAGQGTSVGVSFDEIATIVKSVENDRVLGVCLDTCHSFAAGYDLRGYDGCERVLKEFDAVIGLERLRVFHLNDSKTDLGCRIDRHAPVGVGKLGVQVFHSLVRDRRFRSTPQVLEIPVDGGDLIKQQLQFLRQLQESDSPLNEPKGVRDQSTLDRVL